MLYPVHLLLRDYFRAKNENNPVKFRIILTYLDIQSRSEHDVLSHEVNKFSKNLYFKICHKLGRQHTFLSWKLVDQMCKYEIDLTSIVEDTEWTHFCLQMDGQMDGWMDGQMDRQSETSIYSSDPMEWGLKTFYKALNRLGLIRIHLI